MRFINLTLAIAMCGPAADACTGVYVGRKLTEDGATWIARTVDDRPLGLWHRFEVTPRQVTPTNRIYCGCRGFRRALPTETWRYVSTPRARSFGNGRFVCLGMNEKGLSLTATVTAFTRKEVLDIDPFVPTGAAEESLPEYLIASSATAAEAVDNLAKAMAENGSFDGNIYMFADQREAWYVETYSGHEWAAVRMPEDKMATFGNQFMLGEVEPDADGFRCSPGLFGLIEKAGTGVKGPSGRIHLAASLAVPLYDFGNLRSWWGHRWFAPESAGEYRTDRRLDLFFAADGKVTKRAVFEFMRSRYEGTRWFPDAENRGDIRTVGVETQVDEHLIAVHPDRPPHLAATAWVAFAPCEHSAFFPVSSATTGFDPDWESDSPSGADRSWRERKAAGTVLRRLGTLARIDRIRLGAGVRDYWRDVERRHLAAWPKVEAAALSCGDENLAARIMTDYTVAAQREIYAAAVRITDDLLDYLDDNTETMTWRVIKGGVGIEPGKPIPPFAVKGGTK